MPALLLFLSSQAMENVCFAQVSETATVSTQFTATAASQYASSSVRVVIENGRVVVTAVKEERSGGFYALVHLKNIPEGPLKIEFRGSPFSDWKNAVPQYGLVSDLSDADGFVSEIPTSSSAALTPDTSSQKWHFFSNADVEGESLFVEQSFPGGDAYVSFRVPYTVEYLNGYRERVKNGKGVESIVIGKSSKGNDLIAFQLNAVDGTHDAARPVILIYAREHPDEQDSSWVAEGALDFLLSDDPLADELRSRFTFIVIPLLDPDGAIAGTHTGMIESFQRSKLTPESTAYANWIKEWIDAGNRLDVVLNLHNPPPGSAFHLACPQFDSRPSNLPYCAAMHDVIRSAMIGAEFSVRKTPWTRATSDSRFSGVIASFYGALPMPYEVNSLGRDRHLNLAEIREIGKNLVVGTTSYLESEKGIELLKLVDARRARRAEAWNKFGPTAPKDNPIGAELWCEMQMPPPEEPVAAPN